MENTITLPAITKDDVRKTVDELINIDKILNSTTYLTIIALRKKSFTIMRSLNPIMHQICDCLIIDANIGAITLTNFFIERVLKLAIILKEGNGKTYNEDKPIDQVFKDEIDEFDDNEMEQSINKAKRICVITKEEAEMLKEFRKKYRNSFSHANTQQILDGVTTKIYKASLANPTDIEEEVVNLSTTPLFQEWGLPQYCKTKSFNYFIETFAIANKIEERLKILYE